MIPNTRADLPPTTDQLLADPRVKALVEALDGIARQHNSDEMSREEWDVADFVGGFDICVGNARSALAQFKEPKE
jgi:hypothetical protein